jgi:hypothetical protein
MLFKSNLEPRKMSVTDSTEFNHEIAMTSLDCFLSSAAWKKLKRSFASLSMRVWLTEFNRVVQVWLSGCLPESVADARVVVDKILLKYFIPKLVERVDVESSFFNAQRLRQGLLPTITFLRMKSGEVFEAVNTHSYFCALGDVSEDVTDVDDVAFK